MYQQGEYVVYGASGVCRVGDQTERVIHGRTFRYYQLEPQHGRGATVLVPVDNETLLSRMRPVLSAGEIDALLDALPGEPSEWRDNDQERKERFRAILCGGDPWALARLARSVGRQSRSLAARGRRLRQADEEAWRDAERLLCGEFSFVLGQEPAEILARLHAAGPEGD